MCLKQLRKLFYEKRDLLTQSVLVYKIVKQADISSISTILFLSHLHFSEMIIQISSPLLFLLTWAPVGGVSFINKITTR